MKKMKKRILITLLVVLFILFIKNNVFAAELSNIEITVPIPTIGKKLAKASEVIVKANGNERFEVFKISWSKGHEYNREKVLPLNTEVESGEEYSAMIHYKRPNKYGITSATQVKINNTKRDIDNIDEFNHYGGDDKYDYDCVLYGFGFSKTQKNLSKIEISVPVPKVGNTLAKASEVIVKTDGGEKLEVFKISWSKGHEYNCEKVLPLNTEVEAGEEYSVMIHYKRPNKYGITLATQVKINNAKRDIDNIHEFNHYGGDNKYDYDSVILDGMKIEENTSESDKEEQSNIKQDASKTNKKTSNESSKNKTTNNKISTTETAKEKIIENNELDKKENEVFETKDDVEENNELTNEIAEVASLEIKTTSENKSIYKYVIITVLIIAIITITIFIIKKKNAGDQLL